MEEDNRSYHVSRVWHSGISVLKSGVQGLGCSSKKGDEMETGIIQLARKSQVDTRQHTKGC